MTIAEKLRHIADISEQDPDDLHRVLWRLDVVRDELRDAIDQQSHAFVDDLLRLPS